MSVSVVVQPEAEADLEEAFGWYEARRQGLGHEFLKEVDHVFARISSHPVLHPEGYRGTRQATVRRFPYVALYL